MAINCLMPMVGLWGVVTAASAQPLTLFDGPQSTALHAPSRARTCLIGVDTKTKSCANLSRIPAGPCPIDTVPCAVPWKPKPGLSVLLLGARRALIGPLDECGQIFAADTLGIALTLIDPLMHVGHQLARERPCSLE